MLPLGKGLMTVAAAFAQQLAAKIRASQNQFRPGTAPRRHFRFHDRSDGPNSRTSIHMLTRSVNKGFDYKPDAKALRPHGRESERGGARSPKRPGAARREALAAR